MTKTFAFIGQDLTIQEVISQTLHEAAKLGKIEDEDERIRRYNEIHDATVRYFQLLQEAIDESHDKSNEFLKKKYNDDTARLRAELEDRRTRMRNLIERFWPRIQNPEAGDIASFALLERLIGKLDETARDAARRAAGREVVVGIDPGYPNGFAMFTTVPCESCLGTGETRDDRPGEQGNYGEVCQYCKGSKVSVVPYFAQPPDDESEPFAVDQRLFFENLTEAQEYAGTWNHLACAYNAVQHRETSERYMGYINDLVRSILGFEIMEISPELIPSIPTVIHDATKERARLESKINDLTLANRELKKIIENIGSSMGKRSQ